MNAGEQCWEHKMKTPKIFAALMLTLGLMASAHSAVAQTAATAPATTPPTESPAPSNASASDVVKKFYGTLTDAMKQGDKLGFSGRYKKLEPAIRTAFDLPLMTRFAVGPTWINATPEQQQQLVSAFSDFSVATYASQFTKYDGEKFDVTDEKPASGGGVIVETKLTPKNNQPVALNYLMKKDDAGSWRIVDIFLDGSISELATRRAEFSSIVRRDGIGALVDQLGEKSKAMGPS
jgi:phospholipid transport system substrate-binding protein